MSKRVWLVCAMLPVATAAHAQDAAGGGVTGASSGSAASSVADRGRPDYSPIGGRIGSFFIYPRLDVSGQYNSNLRASTVDKVSDFIVDVRPSVQVASQWARNELALNVYYQRAFHEKYTAEDYGQYGANVSGRYDISRTTTFRLSASGAKLTEPRTDINSTSASRSPIQFSNIAVNASLNQTIGLLELVGAASISKQDFDDAVSLTGAPIFQGFRDNTIVNGSVEARYLFGASTRAIVHLETQKVDYDLNPLNGFDRNSRSYRAEVGLGLEVSRLIYGDVRVGYYKQDNNDLRFLDSSGLSFSANLLYSITPLTSVRLTADRSIEAGGSTITSGNVRSTVALTVDHELLPNLVVSGYGRYAHIDPQGVDVTANEYEGRASAQYYFSRRFRFTGSLSHFARRGNYFGRFDVNVASLGIAVTL